MEKSRVLRGMTARGGARVLAVDSLPAVRDLKELHGLSVLPCAVLGRLMSAAMAMAADLKVERGRVTLVLEGDGPAGRAVADAETRGLARGFISTRELPGWTRGPGKLDLSRAVGKGFLEVIKDLGLREPVRSRVELLSGEIAEDLAYYFAKSEQIPSACALGVRFSPEGEVLSSGGILVQVMPGASEEEISELERRMRALTSPSYSLERAGSLEAFAEEALGEIRWLGEVRFELSCRCSEEMARSIALSMPREEIAEHLRRGEEVEVVCSFCERAYRFDPARLLEEVERLEGEGGR